MNFWANSFQPVAGASDAISRVQLPSMGRIATVYLNPSIGRSLPSAALVASRGQQHTPRDQYRTQCRANCMSKANF